MPVYTRVVQYGSLGCRTCSAVLLAQREQLEGAAQARQLQQLLDL